jgi:di- and tripeptidase
LSIAVRGETIYAGCQDGYIKVLDLETRTLVRTIIVHEVSDWVPVMNESLIKFIEHRGSFPLYAAFRSLQCVRKRPDPGKWKVPNTESFLKDRQRWSASFDCTAESDGHTDSIILSSVVTYSDESGQFQLVTGANDGYIKVCVRDPFSDPTLTFLRYGILNLLNPETIQTAASTVR